MKRIAVLIIVLVIVAGGGFLTAAFQTGDIGATSIPGAKVQCADASCSVFVAEPWQSGQLLLLVGFILVNMIGIGVTLAIIFWALSRQVAQVKSVKSVKGGAAGDAAKAVEKT